MFYFIFYSFLKRKNENLESHFSFSLSEFQVNIFFTINWQKKQLFPTKLAEICHTFLFN